jgi:enoyl-CoA hydratase/carnithine racemase
MDTDISPLRVKIEDGVATITLDRPDRLNALSTEAFRQLEQEIDSIEAGGTARVILLRAQGKHFCTGADLGEVLDAVDKGTPGIELYLSSGQSALRRVEACELPVVAAVQGLCLAGGLELALACDVIFAAKSARFGDQHSNFGFLPGWGGSYRLVQQIGPRRAADLLFSGRAITATDALAWGLINYTIEDENLSVEAEKYCGELARRSRSGMSAMKRLIGAAQGAGLSTALQSEREAVAKQLQSRDGQEGFAAFREKRKPSF